MLHGGTFSLLIACSSSGLSWWASPSTQLGLNSMCYQCSSNRFVARDMRWTHVVMDVFLWIQRARRAVNGLKSLFHAAVLDLAYIFIRSFLMKGTVNEIKPEPLIWFWWKVNESSSERASLARHSRTEWHHAENTVKIMNDTSPFHLLNV